MIYRAKSPYDIPQKMKFSIKDLFSKCYKIRRTTGDLITITEKILNRKLLFFWAVLVLLTLFVITIITNNAYWQMEQSIQEWSKWNSWNAAFKKFEVIDCDCIQDLSAHHRSAHFLMFKFSHWK